MLRLCGSIHWRIAFRATLISGVVIDWKTGQPVPGVEVRFRENNGSRPAARTDARGHFTAQVPEEGRNYLLFAQDGRFGTLLQSTFGETVPIYTEGQQERDIVVPAIPATEVSGHVYDQAGLPLHGCDAWALTDDPDVNGRLVELGLELTDGQGAFRFTYLGADRYFLMARCRKYMPGELPRRWNAPLASDSESPQVRTSFQDVLFPDATTLGGAKPIVLLPGDRRTDIDFHMRLVSQYAVSGTVALPNGQWPDPNLISTLDLYVSRVDPSLAPSVMANETCNWDNGSGKFRCEFLSPGVYRMAFALGKGGFSDFQPRSELTYVAKIDYQVLPQRQKQVDLKVQLEELRLALPNSQSRPAGKLTLQRVCPPQMEEGWPVKVVAIGSVRMERQPRARSCSAEITADLPAGTYTVFAYRTDFFGPHRAAKVVSLIEQQGRQVVIQKGQLGRVSVPVWRTNDVIR